MEFGAATFFTDYSMGPADLGRALEERGFGSLWAPEHSHIPLSRRTPFPQGGDLPKKYYVGGAFPYGARRAIALGDGWVPHSRRPAYGDVVALLPDFRKLAVEAGRDPATIPITIFGVPEERVTIERYRDAGVARVVFNLPPAKADEVLPVLDRCAALIR